MANRKKELEESKKAGENITNKKKMEPPKVEDEETQKNLEKMAPKANKVVQTSIEAGKVKASEPTLSDAKKNTDIPDPEMAAKGEKPKPVKTQPKMDKPEKVEPEKVEEKVEIEVPQEMQESLMNTDEGQIAKQAIENKDISTLESITDPDTNEPFLLPTYDQDGRVTALKPLVPENAELYSKKTGIFLTLLSVVVSSLTGGIFPPINFINLRWDDAKNKASEMENEITRIYNGEIDEANRKLIETRGTEQALSSGVQNPQLYEEGNTEAVARGKAAEQGNIGLEQTKRTLDAQKAIAIFNGNNAKEIAQLQADMQKQITELGLQNALDLKSLDIEGQKALAALLYDQQINKEINQLSAWKASGFDQQDANAFAQAYKKLQDHITTAQAGMGYVQQGANAMSGIASAILGALAPTGATSDKNVKVYDAKPVNSSFLKRNFKWR